MTNIIYIIIIFLTLNACTSSSDDPNGNSDNSTKKGTENTKPVAKIVAPKTILTGGLVLLDGRESTDPEDDQIKFKWKFLSRPLASASTISNTKKELASFSPDVDGQYIVELVVNDGLLDSEAANLTVVSSSRNIKPQANAGSDRQGLTNNLIQLNGSESFDANGDSLSYVWSIVQKPDGSEIVLLNKNTIITSFVPDAPGTYILKLVVNDGILNSEGSQVVITVPVINTNLPNVKPVANAGSNKLGKLGEPVLFNASESNDANNDDLTYQWVLISQPSESVVELVDGDNVITFFTPDVSGVYLIGLTVNDGISNSNQIVVALVISSNQIPVAKAGENKFGVIGKLLQLDGSASLDSDNDSISFMWTFMSRPENSNAQMLENNTVSPSFVPDIEGRYAIGLVVNDGLDNSEQATIIVDVMVENGRPIANAGAEQVQTLGSVIKLDGSDSTDPNRDELTYQWSFESAKDLNNNAINISGLLDNPNISNPSFLPTVAGIYIVSLIVNDGEINSGTSIVKITVTNFSMYRVGVITVNSLEGGGLIIQNNNSDDLLIGTSPPYFFSTPLLTGEDFNISIKSQPISPAQNCTIEPAEGRVKAQAIALTITCQLIGSNTPPEIMTDLLNILENSNIVPEPVKAIDKESNALIFNIVGGVDANAFNIDPTSGIISMLFLPDFEMPLDENSDNQYEILVEVDDGILQSRKNIVITVSQVDEVPEMTNADLFDVNENSSFLVQLTALDPESMSLIFELLNTFDRQYFEFDSGSQQLSLITPKDFEDPQDENSDNQYDLILQVSDGLNTITKNLRIIIQPINDNIPKFTSENTFSVLEMEKIVTTLIAKDEDDQPIMFEILTSPDQAIFKLNESTGELTFIDFPDYENPIDLNNDNIYEIIVQASDGEKNVELMLLINVYNLATTNNLVLKNATGAIKRAYEISIDSSLAYISTYIIETDTYNLQIVDISDPNNPKTRGGIDIFGEINDVFVENKKIYVAYKNDEVSGLQVISANNANEPCTLKNILTPGLLNFDEDLDLTFPGVVTAVYVSNNKAYLSYGNNSSGFVQSVMPLNGFQVIDISKIGSTCQHNIDGLPAVLSKISLDLLNVESIYIKDAIAYISPLAITGRLGLKLIDVKEPRSIKLFSQRNILSTEHILGEMHSNPIVASSLNIVENTVFASYANIYENGLSPTTNQYGLKLYDITDIRVPSYVKTASESIANAGVNEYVYQSVRGRNASLKWDVPKTSIDCTSGCDVTLMFLESYWGFAKGTCSGGERTFSITIEDTKYEDNYDICSNTNAANTAIEYTVLDVISNNVLNIELGLGTVGVDKKPEIAGYYITSKVETYAVNIGSQTNQSFLAEKHRVSNSPSDLSDLAFSDYVADLEVVGTKLYAGGSNGIKVIDISDIRFPAILGMLNTLTAPIIELEVRDDYLFIANGDFGLSVLTLSESEILSLP